MMTTRRTFAAVLVSFSVLSSVAACRACSSDAAPTADAATADAAAHAVATDAAPPYLPARPLPDDSPAPLSIVESALFALRPQLNVCYRTAAKDHPELEGKAMLAVTIGGDGHVLDVATVSQTGLDASMLACLTTAVKGAVFQPPADGGPAVIKVPLTFRPPPRRADAGR